MKIDKVKVGIVGLGLVSLSHIKAFCSHSGAEVVAVCDIDESRAKSYAKKYGISRYYINYYEMLKDKDINTVDIITPTFLHSSMTIAAAKAGKNIHCEKPFCLTLKECIAACEEVERQGVSLMVGESYLFTSAIIKAKELINNDEIGKPRQIRQRFGNFNLRGNVLFDRRSKDISWREDSTKAGGSGYPWLFDHCVHFFALAEYFNNSPIKEVYSLTTPNFSHNKEVPLITWKHEDEECHGVWMGAPPDNDKYYDSMEGFSMTVIGDKGMIEVLGEGGGGLQWQGKDAHLVLHRKGKETLTFTFDEGGDEIWKSEVSYYSRAHRNQIHTFIDCLLHGNKPVYNGFDGMRAVRNAMAAICSAKEGVPVLVKEVTDMRTSK